MSHAACVTAISRSHIVDRLESIASDVNVKFQADASKESVCLYTDEFSLKLIMNSKGKFVATQISNNVETKVRLCLNWFKFSRSCEPVTTPLLLLFFVKCHVICEFLPLVLSHLDSFRIIFGC